MMVEHRLRIGDREVLLVEGPAGWGECSPFPGYHCDPANARRSAEEAATIGWPDRVRDSVPVNAFIGSSERLGDEKGSDLSDRIDRLRGCTSVKVKVGRASPADDIDRIARVRDVIGPTMRLRVDANGAWDVATAIETLTRLARYDLEFAEQPVARLEDLATVRRNVSVLIAADECVRSVEDSRRLWSLAAADVLVLKVQPLGGVRAALEVADAAGVPTVVTSMYETSIGLAAGLALACALPELSFACGLATLGEIAGDVTAEPLVPRDGMLAFPNGFPPRPSPELLARYLVAA